MFRQPAVQQATLQRRFFEQRFDHMIAQLSVTHEFCRLYSQPIDDSRPGRDRRGQFESDLFRGDIFQLAGEHEIVAGKRQGYRIAMQIDPAILFERCAETVDGFATLDCWLTGLLAR